MDCQTELRISTVTYFSTSRAPQSSGPFLPFPLPFLPMIRLRGPRWTARRPPSVAQNVDRPNSSKASFRAARSTNSEGGDPMDTINQISTTDRTPLHTSLCCRSSTEDSSGKKTPGDRGGAGPAGRHTGRTDAHGSHRRTSQDHNHPATHECRDATELGVAARDGVEKRRARDGSPRSRDHIPRVVPPVRYSTVHVPVQYVPSPPGVFLPVLNSIFYRNSLFIPRCLFTGSPRCLFTVFYRVSRLPPVSFYRCL